MGQAAHTHVRVSSFQGLQNLPIYAALRQGYFAGEGLAVTLTFTPGSAPQLAGLVRGEYDLVQTAPDNIISLNTRPDAFGLDPARSPRVVMLLGGSNGPLSVYARRGITTADDLLGATLGVDNPTSGFALVLRDLLSRQGLSLGHDYQFTIAGGTHARCEALLQGAIAATILYTPFDLRASDGGCVRLATTTDFYTAYASIVTGATRPWLDAHPDIPTRYITAILRALQWLHDPANAGFVRALMLAEPALGVAPALVDRAYAAYVNPATGFGRSAALDDAGLRQVIALRATYGASLGTVGRPADYYDLVWYHAAQSRLAMG